MKKQSNTAKIRALLEAGKSVKEVAAKLKVKPAAVYQVRWRMAKDEKAAVAEEVKANEGPVEKYTLHEILATPVTPLSGPVNHPLHEILAAPVAPVSDPVNHPAHYKAGGIETIDFIEAKQLGYHLGNVVKYISRAYHKGGMEDLLKAQWYLNRAIEKGEV